MASHCAQHIRTIEKLKHLIRTLITEAFPAVGIDMVHKQGNIFLCQVIKRSSFRKHIPYEFMVFLGRAFLPGRRCITVKDMRPPVTLPVIFDCLWV